MTRLPVQTVAPSCCGLAARCGAAADRIEGWLLCGPAQIDRGRHRGGIAGRLDRDGRPEFVYLEIVGYYLTAMAWCAAMGASTAIHPELARRRARLAAGWVTRSLSDGTVPPTRLYLDEHRDDWRNAAVFSFDLAMAARGMSAPGFLPKHRSQLGWLCGALEHISAGSDLMCSHALRDTGTTVPERWSTGPGPHHLKAAAALLRLPSGTAGPELTDLCLRTVDHWKGRMLAGTWPCRELHTILYGLEGLLIDAGPAGRPDELAGVAWTFARVMELQAPSGTLPETIDGEQVRSDVLAQALRVGLLLRGRGLLPGADWTDRLDRLAEALLNFVRPDGGVAFADEHEASNTWCAMFAQQALLLHARAGAGLPLPRAAFEFLV